MDTGWTASVWKTALVALDLSDLLHSVGHIGVAICAILHHSTKAMGLRFCRSTVIRAGHELSDTALSLHWRSQRCLLLWHAHLAASTGGGCRLLLHVGAVRLPPLPACSSCFKHPQAAPVPPPGEGARGGLQDRLRHSICICARRGTPPGAIWHGVGE